MDETTVATNLAPGKKIKELRKRAANAGRPCKKMRTSTETWFVG